MRFHFPVIIIDEDFRSENTSGLGIRALAEAIEKEGLEVLGVTSYGDLTSFAQQQSRASAFILSIDDEELALEPEETLAELRAFVSEIRNRNAESQRRQLGRVRHYENKPFASAVIDAPVVTFHAPDTDLHRMGISTGPVVTAAPKVNVKIVVALSLTVIAAPAPTVSSRLSR